MDDTERHALQNCLDSFLLDFKPTDEILLSLKTQGVLSEDHARELLKIPNRKDIVALLFYILPRRGPDAFAIFKNVVEKDPDWLAKRMTERYALLVNERSNQSFEQNLLNLIKKEAGPLVDTSFAPVDAFNPEDIVLMLHSLIEELKTKCFRELEINKTEAILHLHLYIRKSISELKDKTYKLKSIQNEDLKTLK